MQLKIYWRFQGKNYLHYIQNYNCMLKFQCMALVKYIYNQIFPIISLFITGLLLSNTV